MEEIEPILPRFHLPNPKATQGMIFPLFHSVFGLGSSRFLKTWRLKFLAEKGQKMDGFLLGLVLKFFSLDEWIRMTPLFLKFHP